MKYVLILAVAITITLSSQAVARLGNTEDQVNAVLGKPTDPGKPDSDGITTNMYKNPTGEYIAVVQFLKGHSVAEAYSRTDRHELSEKELSIFLEGNSGGNKWEKKPGKKALDTIRPQCTCLLRNRQGIPYVNDPSSLLIRTGEPEDD